MHEADSELLFDDRAVGDAREQFYARDPEPDPQVRRMILASWKRSRDNDVGIDRIRVPYVRDPDLEAPLCRSAAPILDTLGEQLHRRVGQHHPHRSHRHWCWTGGVRAAT